MATRIWWQWVESPHKPWAQLWTAKYVNNRPPEELIRNTNTNTCSLIWNATKQHKELIQQHSLWEIHNGRTACFWVDSWQQQPKILEVLPPQIPEGDNINQNEHVSQHWTQNIHHGFRQWKPTEQIIHQEKEDYHKDLQKELTNRKIRCTNEKDVLRWG